MTKKEAPSSPRPLCNLTEYSPRSERVARKTRRAVKSLPISTSYRPLENSATVSWYHVTSGLGRPVKFTFRRMVSPSSKMRPSSYFLVNKALGGAVNSLAIFVIRKEDPLDQFRQYEPSTVSRAAVVVMPTWLAATHLISPPSSARMSFRIKVATPYSSMSDTKSLGSFSDISLSPQYH